MTIIKFYQLAFIVKRYYLTQLKQKKCEQKPYSFTTIGGLNGLDIHTSQPLRSVEI